MSGIELNTKNTKLDRHVKISKQARARAVPSSGSAKSWIQITFECAFNSGQHGMFFPFLKEWSVHSILTRMECSFHSGWNGMLPLHSCKPVNLDSNCTVALWQFVVVSLLKLNRLLSLKWTKCSLSWTHGPNHFEINAPDLKSFQYVCLFQELGR